MTDVATMPDVPAARMAERISQVTAVEQARAVAEVQAAIVVAQQCPRDRDKALADMRESCSRMSLAARAFYSVPNRGNGPTVHLARELARIWGNVDFGVKEMRRDDDAHESEVIAYAWDQERNTRSVRSFIVPHVRMKGKARQTLTDLGDIYLNNQNQGAKAVRECIFSILPGWFIDEAKDLCSRTLQEGDGEPLEVRVEKMVKAFAGLDVAVDQIEAKLDKKRAQWNVNDLARMLVVFQSLSNNETTRDEEFPPKRVTASEITGAKDQPADALIGPGEFGTDTQAVPDGG